jgi:hypothetical protein
LDTYSKGSGQMVNKKIIRIFQLQLSAGRQGGGENNYAN